MKQSFTPQLLDKTLTIKGEIWVSAELAMEAARVLAKHLSSRIDLHTTDFSATLKGKTENGGSYV